MADYISQYTGGQIDSAVGRALPGGTLEALIADNDPQNWGVGDATVYLTDMNSGLALQSGRYWANSSTANAISGLLHVAVDVHKRSASQIVQRVRTVVDGCELIRTTLDGGATWTIEWLNPPMKLGVEYRTTERYLGKPVYAKAIDFGAMPNNTVKTVESTIDGVVHRIVDYGVEMHSGTGTYALPYQEVDTVINISGGTNSITISLKSTIDHSALSATAWIKYTKVTD